MSVSDSGRAASLEHSQRFLPLLILLFIGSGCSALIYEIVWFQLLELVIGSSSVSIGVLLGTFMGGMFAGSLLAPRLVSRNHHPLRLYAFIEIGIGVIGLLILFGMPLVGGIYTAWAGPGMIGMMLRGIVAAICLLPPTFLMGATLPVISRWVKTSPEGISWLGFFYGGNIGGAVIGSLLAGFYLLRVYDVATTTYAAVLLNFAVAILAFLVARITPVKEDNSNSRSDSPEAASPGAGAVYVTIALSGFTALAAEVIWTRLLSLLFGATVYTFSLILAAFLFGLGIGSTVGAVLARSVKNPRVALGWCQMLLCGTIVWAAYNLMKSMPFWPVDVTLSTDPWLKVQLDMVRCLWAVLPAAILWGASFPLALASVAVRGQDPGRLVGGVYAANTFGAIVGSLGASLVLVQWIGSHGSQQVLIAVSAISGLLMLALPSDEENAQRSNLNFGITVLCLAVAGGLLVMSVPDLSGHFVAYGRFVPIRGSNAKVLYMGEGINASVAVTEMPDGTRNYHNAGKVQASSDPADMRFQRMLGHLTTLIPKTNTDFLVVALGSGVTAGAVSIDPGLKSETVVEIEPLVPKVVANWFGTYNFEVVQNRKVHVLIDDGRHFLQTTKMKFDGITSDPLDQWVKGAAPLYTREYFQLEKDHLKPGGVVTQWVQFYESDEDAVKSVIATFFEVFPNSAIFANTVRGAGYDVVVIGQADPIQIDIDRMQARLDSPDYATTSKSLQEIGLFSAVDLLGTYAGRPSDLQPWLKGAVITHDRDMRIQYLAGMSLNAYHADDIYKNMVKFGPYMPKELFTGSDVRLKLLERAIKEGLSR